MRCAPMLALPLLIGCVELPPEGSTVDPYAVACDEGEGSYAEALSLDSDDAGALTISWGDRDVWALAVTSPGAKIGKMGRLESGDLYWMVAATAFGGELEGPLVYGRIPEHATNYTTFSGGHFEESLDPERCYELQVSDPSHREFGRLQFHPDIGLRSDLP